LLKGSETCFFCMIGQCVPSIKIFLSSLVYCPHTLHACLRSEIRCVCKLTEGHCYWNKSCVRASSFY
jgi:hypothetical protein